MNTSNRAPYLWMTTCSSSVNQQYVIYIFNDGTHSLGSIQVWNYNEITPPTVAIETDRARETCGSGTPMTSLAQQSQLDPLPPILVLAGQCLMAPGQRMLVVRNRDTFQAHYGDALNVCGQYLGKLDNGGERLRLQTITGETILDFTCGDNNPRPEHSNGVSGTWLALDAAGTGADQHGRYHRWRDSTLFGGSPGIGSSAPADIVINEMLPHTNPPMTESDSIELHNTTGGAFTISA